MKILLVEDEKHKKDEILDCLGSLPNLKPDIVGSVNEAVLAIKINEYKLIILDMALPTFGDNSSDKKKGHDQAQGGVEVLRALKFSGQSTNILIVTQFPDFYLGISKVKLSKSPPLILEKYNQNVIGAILYTYKSKNTQQKIQSCLRAFYESNDN